ncbi:MAG: DUF5906 domain-containing protein [Natrinema limicola]
MASSDDADMDIIDAIDELDVNWSEVPDDASLTDVVRMHKNAEAGEGEDDSGETIEKPPADAFEGVEIDGANDDIDPAGTDVDLEVDTSKINKDDKPVRNSAGVIVGYKRGDGFEALDAGGSWYCAECDATFEAERGLKTHYGMKHDGPASVHDPGADDVSMSEPEDLGPVDPDTGDASNPVEAHAYAEDRAAVEEDEEKTPGELWNEAKWAYDAASQPSSPVHKADAREAVVEALAAEHDWVAVAERCDQNYTHLMWYEEDENKWRQDGYLRVYQRVAEAVGAHGTKTEARHAIHQLGMRHLISEDEMNAADDDCLLIPVKNGTLDLSNVAYDPDTMTIDPDTVELLDPDPERYWVYRIDTEWDPDGADLVGLDEWLEEVMWTEEDRRIIWEFAGHSLAHEYQADGFCIFVGDGGGGKSQVLGVIADMLGDDNVTARSLDTLQGQFNSVDVVDACANISTELEGTQLQTMGTLKKMTAGEPTFVEPKGSDGFEVDNSATMMFAADSPPAFPQANKALGRRLYSIEFKHSYVDDPDPNNPFELQARPKREVQKELRAEARLKAALVRAVEGLVRLTEEGDFTSTKHWKERVAEYESFADPVADYARACLTAETVPVADAVENGGSEHGPWIHTHDLLATYDKLAAAKGHPGKTHATLIDQLQKRTGTPIKKDRSSKYTNGSDNDIVYKGITFSREALDYFVPKDSPHREHYEAYCPDDEDTDETVQDGLDIHDADVDQDSPASLADRAVAALRAAAVALGTDRVPADRAKHVIAAVDVESPGVALDAAKQAGKAYEQDGDVRVLGTLDVDTDNDDEGDETGETDGTEAGGEVAAQGPRDASQTDAGDDKGERSNIGENGDEGDEDPPEVPGMKPHDVQCRECGAYWPLVAPNGHFEGVDRKCSRCGTPADLAWNVEHRSLTEQMLAKYDFEYEGNGRDE